MINAQTAASVIPLADRTFTTLLHEQGVVLLGSDLVAKPKFDHMLGDGASFGISCSISLDVSTATFQAL